MMPHPCVPQPLAARLTEQPSPKILLIDDESFMRIQIRRFLEQENYQIIEAANGQEGIDAYKQLHPDMILLDGRMPVMDGFECCRQIQQLPNADYTPVLMITGLEDQASVDKAFAAGATDYVTKPIHWAVLRQRVRRLIQQSQLLQQLETANQQLQYLAAVDGLTQLANRRQLDTHLEAEWRRMAREQGPLSVILCDVDFFKHYNDALGHQAGDECLRQVAQVIGQVAKRPGDLAARYGGEEFAVILTNTDLDGALQVAEMLQASIQHLQLPHPNSRVSAYVTLSTGVSTTCPERVSHLLPEALIGAADKALYEAKAMGRDRICTHVLE